VTVPDFPVFHLIDPGFIFLMLGFLVGRKRIRDYLCIIRLGEDVSNRYATRNLQKYCNIDGGH